MAIDQADLKNTIFIIGGYSNPLGGGSGYAGGPVLKTRKDKIANPDSMHKHFHIDEDHIVSYTTTPQPDGTVKVSFGPAGSTDCAIYLPFLSNNISTAVLDDRADRFFTDNLSGCSIFIDRLPDGRLLVHHANAKAASPTLEQTKADPSYEREMARAIMHKYHDDALRRTNAWTNATNLTVLFKKRYNRAAGNFVNVHRWSGNKDVAFYGGTTVMGFRTGTGTWEFWYQTYGGDGPFSRWRVLCVEKFYP